MRSHQRPFTSFAARALAAGRGLAPLAAALAAYLLPAFVPEPCQAGFHLWFIKEVYTNSTGSVQFIELYTASDGQQFVKTDGKTLTSTTNVFTFPSDTPTPTGNHHVLLATANFNLLPGGATPNYTIPSNFFNPAGDTLNFAAGTDIDTFTSPPIDGINSLNYTSKTSASSIATNSPRNYLGDGISVGTGDYNNNHAVDAADYALWRKTLNQSAATSGAGADGNFSGTVDTGDYTYWRSHFGNAVSGAGLSLSPAAIPEPTNIVCTLLGLATLALRRRRHEHTTAARS